MYYAKGHEGDRDLSHVAGVQTMGVEGSGAEPRGPFGREPVIPGLVYDGNREGHMF